MCPIVSRFCLTALLLLSAPVRAESPLTTNSPLRLSDAATGSAPHKPEAEAPLPAAGEDADGIPLPSNSAYGAAAAKAAKLLPHGGKLDLLPTPPKPQALPDNASDDEVLQQLMRQRKENSKFYQDMNMRLETVPAPSVFIQKLSETLRSALSGVPSPTLPTAAVRLATHPHRDYVLYETGILLILIFLLKRWRMAVARNGFGRAWVHIWTSLALLAGELVLIPWMVFGDDYFEVYRELSQVFNLVAQKHL